MSRESGRVVWAVMALAVATPALADEAELVEQVAVRNRLYNVKGRFELGVSAGVSLLPTLTDHYNFNATAAYNFAEIFALELRVGYSLGLDTYLADEVRKKQKRPSEGTTPPPRTSDMANMWRMGFNSVLGARFQPLYGKINLVAELPIHFQLYVWLGAGVGTFQRDSAVFCSQGTLANCTTWLHEDKVGPLFSGALGFRLFIAQRHGVKLEVRNWAYIDTYTSQAVRASVTPANPQGDGTTTSGLTNMAQLDLGYTFMF